MILDAGPLIDAERNRRRFASLVKVALDEDAVLRTTDAIVAQVWRDRRQVNLSWALSAVEIRSEFGDGHRIGELLAATGTSDVVDAHLAVLARRMSEPILTADIDDLRLLGQQAGATVIDWNADS